MSDGGMLSGWRLDQERRGLMPATIERRGSMLRGWARWCEEVGVALDAPEREDVERFLDAKRTTSGAALSARTRYTWVSAIACFYRWAVRAGVASTNPTVDIVRPKLRRTLPRPVSDEDLAMAIAMAPAQERRWCVLAAYAGLRVGEMASLRRNDIRWDRLELHVTGKGAKERIVPMNEQVIAELRSWPMPSVNRPIFTRPTGATWTAAALSRAGSVYLHGIGIDATLHQFRHWFGTRTLDASRNLITVQHLMGHASPTTTAIYTAFSNPDARAAVRALDGPVQASMF